MNRFVYSESDSTPPIFVSGQKRRRRYGPFRFIWDCFLTFATGGLWLIWIFVREMRR